jgi:hypothetical protein
MSERAHAKGEGEGEGGRAQCQRARRGCRWVCGIQSAHARRSKLGRVYRSYSEGRVVYKHSVCVCV